MAVNWHIDQESIRGKLNLGKLSKLFLLLSLFLKPFYLQASGTFQIGDLCLMISVLLLFIDRGLSFKIERIDFSLFFFVLAVCLINGFYVCTQDATGFLLYSSYYVFNFLVLLAFRKLSSDTDLIRHMVYVLRAALMLQVAIFILGLGRYYDASRYMGSFNDPNQLGFFVFSSLLFILVASEKFGLKRCYLDDLAAIFLIINAASVDMILGLAIIYAVKLFSHARVNGCLSYARVALLASAIGLLICLFVLLPYQQGRSIETGIPAIDFTLNRVGEKISKLGSNDEMSFDTSIIVDRGIDKILYYPEKLIFGAGEGMFSRFPLANSTSTELHSTIFGILFYYGIVPFCLLLLWVYQNFAKGRPPANVALLYLALLVECLFLANQRQPMLWLLIALVSLPDKRGECNELALRP